MINIFRTLLGLSAPSNKDIDEAVAQQKQQTLQTYHNTIMQQQAQPAVLAYIKFDLTAEGDVRIYCDWTDDNSEALAKVYGDMLHYVHSGKFIESTIGVLTSAISRQIKLKPFVETVLERWHKKRTKEKRGQNEPLVSPTAALNMSRTVQDED